MGVPEVSIRTFGGFLLANSSVPLRAMHGDYAHIWRHMGLWIRGLGYL